MRCEELDEIVHDLARGSAEHGGTQASARAHATRCARCAAKLEAARALESDLVALALETEALLPTSAPGDELRAALRERAGTEHARRSRPPAWRWALAAAATVAVTALLTPLLLKTAKTPGSAPPISMNTHESPEAGQEPSEFVALQYGDPMTDLGSSLIVRVQLDPSSVAGLGLPLGDDGGHALQADLLLGEDGVARAIRFVE